MTSLIFGGNDGTDIWNNDVADLWNNVGFKSMVDHPPLAQGSGFHVRKLHDPMVFIRNYALTSRTSRKKITRPCEFHRTFRLFTIVMSRGQGFTYNEIAFHPDPANFHHSDVAWSGLHILRNSVFHPDHGVKYSEGFLPRHPPGSSISWPEHVILFISSDDS